MESSEAYKKIDPLRGTVRTVMAHDLATEFEKKGAAGAYEVIRQYLEKLNITPDFVKQDDERFASWRQKLNTARGIMISNHPSMIDAPLLSQALTRSDVKLVVNAGLYKRVEGKTFQDMLIPATTNSLHEVKSMLSSIRALLLKGGLVWIFPTGGMEINTGNRESIHFASGFALILKELQPADMVYSFHINTQDLLPVGSVAKINTTFLSGRFLPDELNLARSKNPVRVRIDESFSEAGEWQDLLKSTGKKGRNEILTAHYLEQFDIEKDELGVLNRG